MTVSLAERLRTETRVLHTAAERSTFMRVLLRGEMPKAAYGALLRNLYPIYAALERALDRHADHPAIAPIHMPALRRAAALEADLAHLHGSGWRDAFRPQPATDAYVARLRELEAATPLRLLPHAYVRYLGDLSGGQLLSGIVARAYGLRDGIGTAFYEFGDAEETRALTRAFRQGLATISLPAAESDAVVEEATASFRRHQLLFDELARAEGLDRNLAGGSGIDPAT